MELTRNTRIIDLTLGEFEDWMLSKGFVPKDDSAQKKRYVYGIPGIMDLLNVSETTAHRLKKTVIASAVSQCGRKIIVDAELALRLFNSNSK